MNKQQVRLATQAETEIRKYKDDLIIWFKHVCGVELRAPQVLWMDEVLCNQFYLLIAPPRFGKTFLIELVCLYEAATTPFEEGRTWAPKESQAMDSLRYQLNAIKNSEILWNYLNWESGKRMFSSTRYEFCNRSNWHIHGIMGEFEGVNCTIIRGEEFDDLNIERFENRVIPRGGAKNRNGKPTRIRLTGTIQEAKGNIYTYDMNDTCQIGTKFPVELGIALGFYDEKIIELARENLTEEEYRRIYQLEYTSGRNFIWEEKLEKCQWLAKKKGWEGIEFKPGERYHPVGRVYCGLDCGASGSTSTASLYSFQIIEVIGDMALWLYGCNWDPATDPVTLIDDIVDLFYFYRIEGGYGDALKADLIAQMNDALYNARLIRTDRIKFPENTPSNWQHWDFAPQWNTGRAKWIWAGILKNRIERRKLLIPRFDAKDDRPIAINCRLMCSRLLNVREEPTENHQYGKLEYINPKLGDDDFDAINMAMGCINDRLGANVALGLLGTSGKTSETSHLRDKTIASQMGDKDFRSYFRGLKVGRE